MKNTLFTLLFLLLTQFAWSQKYTADWTSIDSRPTPDWWRNDKFGIFIHWGVYSVPAYCSKGNYAEWYQNGLENGDTARINFHKRKYGADFSYYKFADSFKAELFNPDEWARLFEKAGAKYIVLTSKHHDGFCLWPNKDANKAWGFPWNAVDAGPHRDLLGDLFTACRKTSVKPGMYYSLYEWFNPLWKTDRARYVNEVMQPQAHELIEKYKPFVFWTDGEWDAPAETWKSKEFISWVYNEAKNRDSIVLNDRWGSGVRFNHAGIYTPEYQPELDFADHDFEESRGMGFSYGYNRMEDAWDYNSAQTLILHLIDKVSRGGNFLLDIGPDEHGKIPPIMQERLLDIGDWLKTNGEAIYNTRRWRSVNQWSAGRRDYKAEKNEHIKDDWKTSGDLMLKQTVDPEPGYAAIEMFFTYNPKKNDLFAIFPKYPDNKRLIINDLQLPSGTQVTFLDTKENLIWENNGKDVVVKLLDFNPNKMKSRHAFALKIGNIGAFAPKPKFFVSHDFKTMKPSVKIVADPQLSVYYTTDGSTPTMQSTRYTSPIFLKDSTNLKAIAFSTTLLPSNEVSQIIPIIKSFPALNIKGRMSAGIRSSLKKPAKYDVFTLDSALVARSFISKEISADTSCNTQKCAQVWLGFLKIGETGGYRFYTQSDDGSVLYIDGKMVVNNSGEHGDQRMEGMALLEQGTHEIKIQYVNSSGNGSLKTGFSKVGDTNWQNFGATNLMVNEK
jgi:alpha-L-fucosidase